MGQVPQTYPQQLPLVERKIETPVSQTSNTNTMSKIKQVKQATGLMTCIFEHTVTETTAKYEWEGPKMNVPNRQWWDEVMAFFEWTQAEHHSEAQVRVYVNATTREWKAWAFPQRGRTGMTTRELDEHPQTAIQRAQFGDEWLYYCTIHHHCSGSAFQSSTDTANEVGQDGIHITIGKVGSNHYDIHARVYQSRFHLSSIKLDTFWDVTAVKATIPEHMRSMMPDDVDARLAAFEMCTPPAPETTFPEVWKENYIIDAPPRPTVQPMGHFSSGYVVAQRTYLDRCVTVTKWDKDRCEADIKELIKESRGTPKNDPKLLAFTSDMFIKIAEMLMTLEDEELVMMDLMFKHDMSVSAYSDMVAKIHQQELNRELKRALKQEKAGGAPSEVGLPTETDEEERMDYEGHPIPNGEVRYPGYGQGHGLGG
jgi:hypothetical protein